jgi:hypothetical protein
MTRESKLVVIIMLFAGLQAFQSISGMTFANSEEERISELWLLFLAAAVFIVSYMYR